MRLLHVISLSSAFALAACGQSAGPGDADAQTGALTDADRAAILQALTITTDASGQIENACGSRVTPQFVAADLGGEVGVAQLVVIPGGDNSPTCYGDGPGAMMLMRRGDDGFRQIYANQGGFLVVLPSETNGARDIAHGGPGFDHPVFTWNGNEYVRGGSIADGDMEGASSLP